MTLATVLVLLIGRSVTDARQDRVIEELEAFPAFEDMAYPTIPSQAGIKGIVVVKVTLHDDGTVASAAALSGHKLLAGPALENVRKWSFRPTPQKAAIVVYEFNLEGVCKGSGSIFRMVHFNFARITHCRPLL